MIREMISSIVLTCIRSRERSAGLTLLLLRWCVANMEILSDLALGHDLICTGWEAGYVI